MSSFARRALPVVPILVVLLLSSPASAGRKAGPGPVETPAAAIDSLLAGLFRADAPGAAVLVRRDGETILRRGYGLANLELAVPIRPDMVFRLGSVTKQFTAAAVLRLVEQGRIALDAPLAEYLPDYPAAGRTITIEQLLTHTSGIKPYTEMAEWRRMWRQDLSLSELIGLFKNEPADFPPGAKWKYNNSAYVLLGAVIEAASGTSYETFLRTELFEPLGLSRTVYGHVGPVVPGRVCGYSRGRDGFVNAEYLSMTQPHAAGSLMSTVDDLAAWDEALRSGRVLRPETLDKAWTALRLPDGESTGYGCGWFVSVHEGRRVVEHGGGIHGFSTYTLSIPEERLFVALLTNCDNGPSLGDAAFRIAAIAAGRPWTAPRPVPLPIEEQDAWTGVYADADGRERLVTREDDRLFSRRAGGARAEILPVAPFEGVVKDSLTRVLFVRDAAGRVTGLRVEGRIGPAEVYVRTDKPLPAAARAAAVDPAVYDRYAGEYELAPGFVLTVTRRGGRLITQATGQEEVEIFPETETRFSPREIDARIEFVLDSGNRATGLVLTQGGQVVRAKKIK